MYHQFATLNLEQQFSNFLVLGLFTLLKVIEDLKKVRVYVVVYTGICHIKH